MDFNFDLQFDKQVIGVDEVGRGSWAGPVMAAAALIDHQTPIDKRLDDSKKLSSKTRKQVLKNLTKSNTFGSLKSDKAITSFFFWPPDKNFALISFTFSSSNFDNR